MNNPIVLAGDDKRWGQYAPDGIQWPALDVFGKPYDRHYINVRIVGNNRFVVIPPQMDSDALTILPATAMTELPTDEPRKARK